MNLTQSWVGYLDRSYEQIKASLLKRLTVLTPEISDHNESNILIVILSMFAGIAEQLNLYIDNMAKEAFIGTARRYTSMVKLVKLIDYRIKARIPATVVLTAIITDNTGAEVITPSTVTIPKGSIINSSNNLPFVLQRDIVIIGGTSTANGNASQYTTVSDEVLGTTTGIALQQVPLPQDYAHNSIVLTINSEEWTESDSLGLLLSTDKKFIVDILEDGNAYVIFGDGINGVVPPVGNTIYGTYNTSEGVLGNLPPNTITDLQADVATPLGLSVSITNRDYSSNGADFEGLEEIRNRAPRSIRTLYRAVTYKDYEDVGIQAPGVGKAIVKYCCGKAVDLYIAPTSRGVATPLLLDSTKTYFEDKRMVTTQVSINPAGITRIYIKGTLYGAQFYTADQVFIDAVQALNNEFGYDNSEINKTVKISTIITTLENLASVDSLDIAKIYIEPFLRPFNPVNIIPQITYSQISSKLRHDYRLIYHKDINSYDVYRDGVYVGNAVPGILFTTVAGDPLTMGFTIANNTNLSDMAQYSFVVFPTYPENFPDYSIEIDDFSVPIFDILESGVDTTVPVIFSDLQVVVTAGSTFKKPNC